MYPEENLIQKGGTFLNLSAKEKLFFFVQVVGIFAVTFIILYVVGFIPKEFKPAAPIEDVQTGSSEDTPSYVAQPQTQTRPDRIVIDKISLDATIGHPTSQNIQTLDQFLNQGVVHYPGSGFLEEGNIFLFGHSADRFQLVSNPALKIFNGLYKLERGDLITLQADNKEYIYEVTSVALVNADTAFVDFSKTGQTLTISTCNTFGKLQERWVVEATLKTSRS